MGGGVGGNVPEKLPDRLGAPGGGAEDDQLFRLGGDNGSVGKHRIGGKGGNDGGGLELRALSDPGHGRRPDLLRQSVGVVLQGMGAVDLGLADEVHRSDLQSPEDDIRPLVGLGGDHQHRHGAKAHELFQKVEAVHPGHLDIEGQHVGVEIADHLPGRQGIGSLAHHDHIVGLGNDSGEDPPDQGRVVHDQNLYLPHPPSSGFLVAGSTGTSLADPSRRISSG